MLAATDLSFASPGGRLLSFDCYYNSGYLGNENLGLGWQMTATTCSSNTPRSFIIMA